MLATLAVRNYAVVAETALELGPGMTALSGETGAGKSIVVGALGLVLGDRADAGIVRDGADRAEISAHFDVDDEILAWLEQQSLGADGECLVRRVVSREGRSRAWINGHAVTLKTLAQLGAKLVDIHGQHAHQSLTRRATQRAILDGFAGNQNALEALAAAHERWQAAARELERLEQAAAERDTRLDLARFQLQELDALAPEPGEAARLVDEQRRLAHAGRLVEDAAAALATLTGDDDVSAQALVARAAALVRGLAEIDPALANTGALLADAEIQLSEAAAELADYGDDMELDPARRDWVEERLATMQALARKHRVDAGDLAARRDALAQEVEGLEHNDERRAALRATVENARAEYDQQARSLHRRRTTAARKLDRAISAEIEALGMSGGRFVTRVSADPNQPRAHGIDTVVFEVSANAGQEPRPLARVASGGELARISLAIEMLAARHAPTPTMVFDEVDAGVGGRVAEIVGQKLRALGERTQVLCVTHLPQVASQAHAHVLVAKHSDGRTTNTELRALDDAARTEEIARMLGGVEITRATRRHAEEMLARAGGTGTRTAAS